MEQLRVRAERYRKRGRLRDEDLDEIIKDIKETGGTEDNETTAERERATLTSTTRSKKQWRTDCCKRMVRPQIQSSMASSGYWARIVTDSTIESEEMIRLKRQ